MIPQSSEPTYWQIQLQLVTLLSFIGLNFRANERLDLFRLKHKVRTEYPHEDKLLLGDIDFLIDELVARRLKGLEPTHDGKRYV